MRELTEKQKLFVAEYLICLNATQAAISAGYSAKSARYTGRDLLKDPRIDKLVQSSLDSVQSEKISDVEEIMQYLTAVMRGQTEATVIVTERRDDGTTVARLMKKQPSEKERIRAAELLARRYGLLKGDVNISGTANVTIVDNLDSNPFAGLTTEQLIKLADSIPDECEGGQADNMPPLPTPDPRER